MMKRHLMFAVAFAAAILASSSRTLLSAEQSDQALIKAIGGAKISLLQGIAQVAKTEVPTDAKYELEDGKLMLSIYTSDTAAEDNSFNEYGGDATATDWAPNKEVFTDLKHIARSAQYHTLLSMTKMTLSGDHPKGFGARHRLFRQGKDPQRQTCLRGNDGSGQYRQDNVL